MSFWTITCVECGRTVELQKSMGNKPVTCSDACRGARHRKENTRRVKEYKARKKLRLLGHDAE